ncbi:hypothetical protein J6590_028772 [Homalodisca vitripennis]|nr:hypothetical protein J6590_028772 [Homalodisca vitripennis]
MNIHIHYVNNFNKQHRTNQHLIAILQATFTLATIRQKDIIIFSDSQAAITALSVYNYSKGEGIPVSIIHNVIDSGKNVTFHWVPAHVGIYHNEYIDNLAKQAIADGTKLFNIYIPTSDFKAYQQRQYAVAYKQVCQRTPKAAWYKEIESTTGHSPWFIMTNFKR